MANRLVNRNEWAAYMEIPGDTPSFALIGEGFTDLTESKNPIEYARHYVHERTERTDVTGYATSLSYSADVYSEDPVMLQIAKVHDEELVGSDAQRDVVTVHLWEPAAGGQGKYVAYRRRYAIIPDGKGSGTDALIYTGTLKAVGDQVKGSFDAAAKTFTEDAGAGA